MRGLLVPRGEVVELGAIGLVGGDHFAVHYRLVDVERGRYLMAERVTAISGHCHFRR
jgi:hypothetical protein